MRSMVFLMFEKPKTFENFKRTSKHTRALTADRRFLQEPRPET